MTITLATAAQNFSMTESTNSFSQNITVNDGNLLLVAIAHPRDSAITSPTWNSAAMTTWTTFNNPVGGWSALSVFALKDFALGTKTLAFTVSGCVVSEWHYKYISVCSFSGANSFHNSTTGSGTTDRYLNIDINTDVNDCAVLICRDADQQPDYNYSPFLRAVSQTPLIAWGNIMKGQYAVSSGSQVRLTQYTLDNQGQPADHDLHITYSGFAITPYSEAPSVTAISGKLAPMWFT